MSVHQTKDGRWYCQYRVPGSRSKKREYFGRGAAGRSAAYTRDDEVKAEKAIALGRKRRHPGPTFGELANVYTRAKMGSMAQVSMDLLLRKLAAIIVPEIGSLRVHQITPERLDAYTRKRLKTVKTTTVHRELSDIIAILNWAANRKIIMENPVRGYQKPKRDDEIIQPPTIDETRRILAKAPEHLARAITLSLYTGLRPGQSELLRLKWNAVDWDQKTLHVVSARKGGRYSRTIPLHPVLLEHLEAWFAADRRAPDRNIITWKGKPVQRINKAFTRAKKAAGIRRRLTLYSFRHAFATQALAAGADLKSTSEIMGHSRPDTTMRIYQHVSLDQYRQVVDRLPNIEIPITQNRKRVTRKGAKPK